VSDGSGKGEVSLHTELKISPVQNADATPTTGADTSDAFRNKKKQDRSSCGSNTPSSSDVDADNVPEKEDNANEKVKQASCSNNSSAGDTNHRRFRSSGSTSDSWKEVSEEVVIYQQYSNSLCPNLSACSIAFLIHFFVDRVVWLSMRCSVEKSFRKAFLPHKQKTQRRLPRRRKMK
jgi:hypothetical protein